MSRKGKPNLKGKTVYPRKCEHCSHLSNNPSAYFYHKRIHEVIPSGKLCDQGCGNIARYKNTNGKYTCEEVAHRCPEYIRTHSIRIKNQWENDIERKNQTRLTVESRLNTPENIEKRKQTLKTKWGNFTPEEIKEYKRFARRIRTRAQRWAKSQGYVLGQQTYHVDHKLSIFDAWKAGLSEEIINHPANLQIIDAKENSKKGAKSSISLEKLLEEINALCEQVAQNDA